MSSDKRTVVKNASVMMVSQIITWILATVLALFLPKYLGSENLGMLAIATSLWAIAGVMIGFGMDTYLTKTIAQEPHRTPELVGTSMLIRAVLFIAGFAAVWLYMVVMDYSSEIRALAIVLAFSTLGTAFGSSMSAALNGLEQMQFVSLATVVGKMVVVGLSLLAIVLNASVYWIAAANIGASLVGVSIVLYGLTRYHPIQLRFRMADARAMMSLSWPFLVTALALAVYMQIDQLFIASLVSTTAVGYYSAAMLFYGTLMFLPTVFGTVLFPVLARGYASGNSNMNAIIKRGLDLILLMSLPIGMGIAVIGEPLIVQIQGEEYRPAGQILGVFGAVLIFTYLNTLLGQLLVSMNRTSRLNMIVLLAIAVTLPLDLLLVPWAERTFQNGALGGAFSFLCTEFAMCVVSLLLLPRGTLAWSNVRNALLTLVAAVTMMAACWWWRESAIVVSVVVGALVYVAMVVVLRILPQEDWDMLRSALREVLGRIRSKVGVPVSVSEQ